LNAKLRDVYAKIDDYVQPCVFVIGVPRSGTTVTAQLIANAFDVGWIDHVAARFWEGPGIGVRLSMAAGQSFTHASYTSHYGRTLPGDPHEFGYFWEQLANITPTELCARLADIQDAMDQTLLMKALGAMPWLGEVVVSVPALWIHVHRDDEDVIKSLLGAREAYYGDKQCWWGGYPGVNGARTLMDPYDQVRQQVVDTKAHIVSSLGSAPCVDIEYADVVRNPRAVVRKICAAVAAYNDHDACPRLQVALWPRGMTDHSGAEYLDAAERDKLIAAHVVDHVPETLP